MGGTMNLLCLQKLTIVQLAVLFSFSFMVAQPVQQLPQLITPEIQQLIGQLKETTAQLDKAAKETNEKLRTKKRTLLLLLLLLLLLGGLTTAGCTKITSFFDKKHHDQQKQFEELFKHFHDDSKGRVAQLAASQEAAQAANLAQIKIVESQLDQLTQKLRFSADKHELQSDQLKQILRDVIAKQQAFAAQASINTAKIETIEHQSADCAQTQEQINKELEALNRQSMVYGQAMGVLYEELKKIQEAPTTLDQLNNILCRISPGLSGLNGLFSRKSSEKSAPAGESSGCGSHKKTA